MDFDMKRMTSTATISNNGSTLTMDILLEGIKTAKRELENSAFANSCGPLCVKSSPFATKTEPVRIHKKRSNQRNSYHIRVQKKWTKRFGTKQVPCAYVIDNSVLGFPGRTIVAHPEHLVALRNLGNQDAALLFT